MIVILLLLFLAFFIFVLGPGAIEMWLDVCDSWKDVIQLLRDRRSGRDN